jgi:hypothetical protein
MYYLVYDNTTFRVFGFFYNVKMAEARVKELKRTDPLVTPTVLPYSMSVYMDTSL